MDHRDGASEGGDAVVGPTVILERVEVGRVDAHTIELHQASQRHDYILVSIAQVHQWGRVVDDAVAHVHHVTQYGSTGVGLIATIERATTVVDVVPGILLAPVLVDLLGRKNVPKGYLTGKVGMLVVTCEDKELTGQQGFIDVGNHIVHVVEERTHESAIVGVEGCEPIIASHGERVGGLGSQLFIVWGHITDTLVGCPTAGRDGLQHGRELQESLLHGHDTMVLHHTMYAVIGVVREHTGHTHQHLLHESSALHSSLGRYLTTTIVDLATQQTDAMEYVLTQCGKLTQRVGLGKGVVGVLVILYLVEIIRGRTAIVVDVERLLTFGGRGDLMMLDNRTGIEHASRTVHILLQLLYNALSPCCYRGTKGQYGSKNDLLRNCLH